jgi:hypothetical protein
MRARAAAKATRTRTGHTPGALTDDGKYGNRDRDWNPDWDNDIDG